MRSWVGNYARTCTVCVAICVLLKRQWPTFSDPNSLQVIFEDISLCKVLVLIASEACSVEILGERLTTQNSKRLLYTCALIVVSDVRTVHAKFVQVRVVPSGAFTMVSPRFARKVISALPDARVPF